jgi:hypothetical protein
MISGLAHVTDAVEWPRFSLTAVRRRRAAQLRKFRAAFRGPDMLPARLNLL